MPATDSHGRTPNDSDYGRPAETPRYGLSPVQEAFMRQQMQRRSAEEASRHRLHADPLPPPEPRPEDRGSLTDFPLDSGSFVHDVFSSDVSFNNSSLVIGSSTYPPRPSLQDFMRMEASALMYQAVRDRREFEWEAPEQRRLRESEEHQAALIQQVTAVQQAYAEAMTGHEYLDQIREATLQGLTTPQAIAETRSRLGLPPVKPLCACGCGIRVRKLKSRFCMGHNMRALATA